MAYNDNRGHSGGNFSLRTPYGYTPGYKANDGRADYMVPIHTVRQLLSSPLVLAGTICLSLYIILYLVGVFTGEAGSLMEISDSIPAFSSLSVMITAAVAVIPEIILAVGLWLTYFAAAHRSSRSIKTTGITMIKVITIIKFVIGMVFFAVLILVFALAAVMVFSGSADEILAIAGVSAVIIAVLLGIIAACCAVTVIYYIMLIKSLTTIKRTVSSGRPSARVSVYAAIVSFLLAICSAYTAGLFFGYGNIFMSISCAFYVIALILFGIFLIIYKIRLRSMTDGMIFY